MTDAVSYELRDRTALLTIDDGKANALSFDVLGALNATPQVKAALADRLR